MTIHQSISEEPAEHHPPIAATCGVVVAAAEFRVTVFRLGWPKLL